MDIGNRIIVLGCPGSGKSTFARKLRDAAGLPLIYLDSVWWLPDGTHITREEFDRRLDTLIEGDRWIIEGDYSRTYEKRIAACDTVILLDPGEAECMRGIRERLGKERPELPWKETGLDPALVDEVRNYRSRKLSVLTALLEKYSEKRTLVFRSREEADQWLAAVKEGLK